MPNEFAVIGERREDQMHLFVIGLDGRSYDYDPTHDQATPVEVDEHWRLFSNAEEVLA